MKIISSTDYKYLGTDLSTLKPGDTVLLGDFEFEIQFIRKLDNGNTVLGNINYQLECEV